MITVLYFARFRERLGIDREDVALPSGTTVQALLDMLAGRGGQWQELFGCERGVLVAVNQAMATRESVITDGDELAVFPPVTGG
ncbi:MAG: molybdopterin converting factor, subunit 1 [Moraxellaceae bacterium]|jgi:molybdopterin synthase sulfur carrier subunit|nr:molybdopterin converting factor, subunit 1 [Moraxellaceae bacterium]